MISPEAPKSVTVVRGVGLQHGPQEACHLAGHLQEDPSSTEVPHLSPVAHLGGSATVTTEAEETCQGAVDDALIWTAVGHPWNVLGQAFPLKEPPAGDKRLYSPVTINNTQLQGLPDQLIDFSF